MLSSWVLPHGWLLVRTQEGAEILGDGIRRHGNGPLQIKQMGLEGPSGGETQLVAGAYLGAGLHGKDGRDLARGDDPPLIQIVT